MNLAELKANPPPNCWKWQPQRLENANRFPQTRPDLRAAQATRRKGSIRSSSVLEVLPTASASCVRPRRVFSPAPTTSTSRRRRSVASTCIRAIRLKGEIRTPKDGERYFALVKLDSVSGEPPEGRQEQGAVRNLTPLFPDRAAAQARARHQGRGKTSPAGDRHRRPDRQKGQRGLLVAPPEVQQTVMLQHVAHAIASNHPDVVLIVLLIDERPEEVTDMQRTVPRRGRRLHLRRGPPRATSRSPRW